jgi:hypothetical protein
MTFCILLSNSLSYKDTNCFHKYLNIKVFFLAFFAQSGVFTKQLQGSIYTEQQLFSQQVKMIIRDSQVFYEKNRYTVWCSGLGVYNYFL